MKESLVNRCKKCRKPVSVISYGIYRNVLVDAEAVTAVQDMEGETFIRMDGTKMRGREVEMDEEVMIKLTRGTAKNPFAVVEYVYRPHAKTCGLDK